MAFTKHIFILDGVEHAIQTPAGSEASNAVAMLISEHARAMKCPQMCGYVGDHDGVERWDVRMCDGSMKTYDIKEVIK